MNAAQFVSKWREIELSERSACQQHSIDLCELAHHPKPAEADKTGESFTFEKGAEKHGGAEGWADVCLRSLTIPDHARRGSSAERGDWGART